MIGPWRRHGQTDINGFAWNNAGQLLTQSVPAGQGWAAQSKAHGVSDPGWVAAYAIGIHKCPIYFSGCLDGGLWYWNGLVNSSGYKGNSFDVPDTSFAMTAVGAQDYFSVGKNGRLLTDIIPTVGGSLLHGGVLAYSKDHVYPDATGNLAVYMLALRKSF